ncbi:MAG TPA: HAMP domain-containing sensor histidine kinase [Polyangia bacterium]|nr:HAMP domain-containing sensor histidine kinase [Polyangia bacterium]
MSPATRTGSLRWRFTAWLFVALVGLAGPLAVYYQLRIDHLIAREADERLSALARHLASGALLGVLAKSEELLEGTLEGALSEQDVLGVAAFDASGGLIASRTRGDAAVPTWSAESTSCQPCAIDNHRLRWVAPVHRRRSAGGARTQEDFYSGPPPSSSRLVGWIVMEVSTERRRAAEREVGRRGLLISLTVLAVALVLTLFVARRLTSPLRSLAAATREIARGKWDAPLPTRSQGEIAQLALDFRDMTAALAELDRENRTYRELLEERVQLRTRELQEAYDRLKAMADEKDQFVATVSHDFRSPLAVILASIQTILADDAMPAGARRDFLDRAARQCKRLGSLVSDLLDLARIENRDAEIRRVSLGQIVEDVVDGSRSNFEARGVRLAYDPPAPPIDADVDRGQVERAVANLLGNAAKFTPTGGSVTVSVGAQGDHAVIRVTDTGPGIPSTDLRHVFERFFQGEGGRAAGGSGLGLAIVAGVARRHGGDVKVTSTPGQGATFELFLPKTSARPDKEKKVM